MTTIDYKALAGRIEAIAKRQIDGARLSAAQENDEQAKRFEERAADLRTVVSLLEGMAEAEPIAWMRPDNRVREESVTGKQFNRGAQRPPIGSWVPLFLRPAPQPQPERQPLTDEQINEIGEPFGYFQYGDAQGDKRRAFVRAIENFHGIGYGKAIEGGPSEPRSCTCHPDDNPPVPCAQQYALNECRAASEPTEAQIEARDALLDFISENGTASEGVQHYLDRYVRAALAAERQPVSEPTNSELLRAAGYTRRDNRIECDECGKKFTPQMLPIHKCEPTEAQITGHDVRRAYNLCPRNLATLARYRWIANYLNEVLRAALAARGER